MRTALVSRRGSRWGWPAGRCWSKEDATQGGQGPGAESVEGPEIACCQIKEYVIAIRTAFNARDKNQVTLAPSARISRTCPTLIPRRQTSFRVGDFHYYSQARWACLPAGVRRTGKQTRRNRGVIKFTKQARNASGARSVEVITYY